MDLQKYNDEDGLRNQQCILDDSITAINIAVNKCNERYDAVAPWLARDVHRNTKMKKITRYHKLAEDGVHLTEVLKGKWAAEIMSSLHKNKERVLMREGRRGNLHRLGSDILTPP